MHGRCDCFGCQTDSRLSRGARSLVARQLARSLFARRAGALRDVALPSLSELEQAESHTLLFLSAVDVASLAAASRRTIRSAGGQLWSTREAQLYAGTARRLRVLAEVEDEHEQASRREALEDWYRISDLLRQGGWSDDD